MQNMKPCPFCGNPKVKLAKKTHNYISSYDGRCVKIAFKLRGGAISVKIERIWSMPNKWTFTIKPIAQLLKDEMGDGVWIDPFAGEFSPAAITNDLNPDRHATYHMDALEFLKMFPDSSVDGVLYDPPYSNRQVRECYDGIDGDIKWDGRTTFWSETKNEVSRVLKQGGKAICFGWNSMGIGINRGFDMTRVLMVPHGGAHNDTICTVEVKR